MADTEKKKPISDPAARFGQRVRARRNELGYSQEALAEHAGLHWTYVSQVERGQRNVSLHNMLKFAVGLQIDPGELITGLEPDQEN